ncbi:MAG: hypothetical protein ABSH08_22580, partial [Tepidisphaeraceae bacterium]
MFKKLALTLLFALFAATSFAQVAPQYALEVNFFNSGIYGQTSALNTVFNYQLTTNLQLEGDLLAAPGGGLSDYEAGASYDLCGIKAVENALALTSLNCGKMEPFAAIVAGMGKVQQGTNPASEAPAFMAKLGVSLPTSSGSFAPEFVGGYGDFGPSVAGQSNKGWFFYSGFTFGGGN